MKHLKVYEGYVTDWKPSREKAFIVSSGNIHILHPEMKKAYDNMKFHIGDLVKLAGWEKFTFTIVEVEIYSDHQPYHLEDDKSSTWRNEDEIEIAPDFEIAAKKYNL